MTAAPVRRPAPLPAPVGVVLTALAPLLVGLYVAATTFAGGTALPWHPRMVDLAVYRRAAAALLQGADLYDLPRSLPFLYPPVAAVLSVPLALLPQPVAEIGWTATGLLALSAVVRRCGLTGWSLALVTTAAVLLAPPVRQTLAYGQVGIVLVALVFLDLAPGARRRVLPVGVLTGVAVAIKLTPALFVVYLLVVRRWRAAAVAGGTAALLTGLAAVAAPRDSITFWGRLVHGDTGLGHSILYVTNQSVLSDVLRAFGFSGAAATAGLVLAGAVAALGLGAATRWHRERPDLALAMVGIAGLLASPVSWLHHFVWIVPLAVLLLRRPVPAAVRLAGLVLVGWLVAAPFQRLPAGGDIELAWTLPQQLLGSLTAILGTVFLAVALVVGPRLPPRGQGLGRTTTS